MIIIIIINFEDVSQFVLFFKKERERNKEPEVTTLVVLSMQKVAPVQNGDSMPSVLNCDRAHRFIYIFGPDTDFSQSEELGYLLFRSFY